MFAEINLERTDRAYIELYIYILSIIVWKSFPTTPTGEYVLNIIVAVDGISESAKLSISRAAAQRATLRFISEQQSDWSATLAEVDIVFGWPPVAALEESAVTFLQLPSSGYDMYDTLGLRDKPGFLLANSRGVVANAVTEHCLAMMFALARNLPDHVRDGERRSWHRAQAYDLLQGSTVAIVGMGAIGTMLAQKCAALGMSVIAVQRGPEVPEFVVELCPFHEMDRALQAADHVVLTLAALPNNAILFGREEFLAMRQGSVFYNLGRGSLVDTAALSAALQAGHLRGAALDVFPEEPLPSVSQLWEIPNLLITPHVGGRFTGEVDALAELFARNLGRYLAGEPLVNVVLGHGSIPASMGK